MAKKTKKTKITETIVTQLQNPEEEVKEVPVEETIKEEKKKKPEPQTSKFFDTPVQESRDPETSGINFGIGGVL